MITSFLLTCNELLCPAPITHRHVLQYCFFRRANLKATSRLVSFRDKRLFECINCLRWKTLMMNYFSRYNTIHITLLLSPWWSIFSWTTNFPSKFLNDSKCQFLHLSQASRRPFHGTEAERSESNWPWTLHLAKKSSCSVFVWITIRFLLTRGQCKSLSWFSSICTNSTEIQSRSIYLTFLFMKLNLRLEPINGIVYVKSLCAQWSFTGFVFGP